MCAGVAGYDDDFGFHGYGYGYGYGYGLDETGSNRTGGGGGGSGSGGGGVFKVVYEGMADGFVVRELSTAHRCASVCACVCVSVCASVVAYVRVCVRVSSVVCTYSCACEHLSQPEEIALVNGLNDKHCWHTSPHCVLCGVLRHPLRSRSRVRSHHIHIAHFFPQVHVSAGLQIERRCVGDVVNE